MGGEGRTGGERGVTALWKTKRERARARASLVFILDLSKGVRNQTRRRVNENSVYLYPCYMVMNDTAVKAIRYHKRFYVQRPLCVSSE